MGFLDGGGDGLREEDDAYKSFLGIIPGSQMCKIHENIPIETFLSKCAKLPDIGGGVRDLGHVHDGNFS